MNGALSILEDAVVDLANRAMRDRRDLLEMDYMAPVERDHHIQKMHDESGGAMNLCQCIMALRAIA